MVDVSKLTQWTAGKLFDQSVLAKNSTEADIRLGAREAIKYNCAAFLSATPYWLTVILEEL